MTTDSPEIKLPPGNTPPGEPVPAQSVGQSGQQNQAASQPSPRKAGDEEPELALEPDLPSDGRDHEGEAMIRDLPQRPELSQPPGQPDSSSQNQNA